MIEGITFDFWDTIAIDDSDEQKRMALGLPSKSEARSTLFVQKVTDDHPGIDPALAAEAYRHANSRFEREWHEGQHTPGVTARLFYAYEYLGLYTAPGQYANLAGSVDELVRAIEDMEVRIPPDLAPGILDVIPLLAEEYKLGIISDTIHTNGHGLRHLLAQYGIIEYFSYFVFSNEIGISKPAPAVFRQAAIGLDISPPNLVHIGDRESNDVDGPLANNMKAILYTGVKDRRNSLNGQTRASAVCDDHGKLPLIIKRLR